MIYNAKYAGSWYPGTQAELKEMLKTFFDKVDKTTTFKKIKGLIAPHAGFIYSGQTAAFGFKQLSNADFDTVVLLAPSHKAFIDKISIFNFSQIKTPLGLLNVDMKTSSKLLENSLFIDEPIAYMGEHSFELELPFLQYVSKDREFEVLPLIVGELSLDEFKTASETLENALQNRKPVFIVSSDFTHYGESFGYLPFRENVKENLEKLDMEGVKNIIDLQPEEFFNYLNQTGATICGKNPILFLMNLLADQCAELLNYTNSGQITGDFDHSVSYASIVFGI